MAENFPLAVERLLQPREYRAELLRDLFQPVNGIGAGYKHLAELVLKGLIRTGELQLRYGVTDRAERAASAYPSYRRGQSQL